LDDGDSGFSFDITENTTVNQMIDKVRNHLKSHYESDISKSNRDFFIGLMRDKTGFASNYTEINSAESDSNNQKKVIGPWTY